MATTLRSIRSLNEPSLASGNSSAMLPTTLSTLPVLVNDQSNSGRM